MTRKKPFVQAQGLVTRGNYDKNRTFDFIKITVQAIVIFIITGFLGNIRSDLQTLNVNLNDIKTQIARINVNNDWITNSITKSESSIGTMKSKIIELDIRLIKIESGNLFTDASSNNQDKTEIEPEKPEAFERF